MTDELFFARWVKQAVTWLLIAALIVMAGLFFITLQLKQQMSDYHDGNVQRSCQVVVYFQQPPPPFCNGVTGLLPYVPPKGN